MIANSAFLAAMVLMLLVFLLMDQLEFLAAHKRALFGDYLWVIVGASVVLFLNLFAAFYLTARGLFLKETGRKLAHVEKQLQTGDTIVRDLSERLAKEER
jgi:K+ transporter